ncbi:GGDEF domain-containing protein [Croceibacterium sp. TMG7-5b_MA50]|uniref:GGDEF domain-containing protein n=1 Tax=Croceibacterium sp. TMG7-5b_MA50 TaxID=3121290 RepID=UPI0032220C0F
MLDDTHSTTIAACSTALAVIMCIAVLLSLPRLGVGSQQGWQVAPFALAVPSGVLLTWPDLLAGGWGLQLGWCGLTLVYGAAWTAVRVSLGRPPLPWAVLLPCLAVLGFSLTLGSEDGWPQVRMLPRVMLFALFNLLSAREFWLADSRTLPAAGITLRWMFTLYAAVDLARTPLALMLPAPFGPAPTEVWSIAVFNFLLVLEGLLLGHFLAALGREQQADRNLSLAMVDPLTGAGNRRALEQALTMTEGPSRPGRQRHLAIAVFDIDRFKQVNDDHGHPFGDVVIAGAAEVARGLFAERQVFRTGGEEFAVLFRAGDAADAVRQAESLRQAFADRSHHRDGIVRRCTISIGVALDTSGLTPRTALAAADAALYAAKRGGRNCTILADTDALMGDGPWSVGQGSGAGERPAWNASGM